MKKKKLVIFFLMLPLLYLIYKFKFHEVKTYLSLGDDLAKGHTPFDTYNSSYTDYLFDYLKTEKNYTTLNNTFIEEDLRINDLITLIKTNEIKNGVTLPQALKEANLITLSIGSEELFSKIRSNEELLNTKNDRIFSYIDDMMIELNNLINEIHKITASPIYIIGLYNIVEVTKENDIKIGSIFNYLDIKYKSLEQKNKNIYYVPIYEGFKNKPYYLPNKTNAFPSLEGYNYIANQIIEKIES